MPVDGGTWSGLLFDNPRIGVVPQLTWRFTFPYIDVVRDYGRSPVALTLERTLDAPGMDPRWILSLRSADLDADVCLFPWCTPWFASLGGRPTAIPQRIPS